MKPVIDFLRAMAGKVVVPKLQKKLAKFEKVLAETPKVQRELLFAKIRRAAPSAFGKDHGFDKIKTLEDFRRQVPIASYDYYWPYIERVTNGELGAMFPDGDRLLMCTLSSGTTAQPKLIPINDVWMDEYRRGWELWGVKAFLDHPPLFYSKLAGIAGDWDMRRTPTGVPCGMASGLSARMQSLLVRMVYCVPAPVFEIDDPDVKYYTALRLSISEPTGMFTTATPATVVNFARLGDRYKESLIRDIRDGDCRPPGELPPAIRALLSKRLRRRNPDRAAELETIVARTGTLYPKDYWNMHLVACWLGGTVGGQARQIAEYYGDVPRRDIGLLCSEGRFTIPMDDETPAGVLEVASHYFEFVPVDEIDSKQPTVLEAHELERGKDYYILLTTSSGLYRYHISDVLRCVDFRGQAPVLEFLNKGSRFADMEGEKVSENQLVQAAAEAAEAVGIRLTAFTAVPVRPEQNNGRSATPYYAIAVEKQDVADVGAARQFLSKVDGWLTANNVMYAGKRADGYIGPPRLVCIPEGSWRAYDQAEIARRGVGEDHYKHPSLVLDEKFLERFERVGEIGMPG
jgi:hypothetical protein